MKTILTMILILLTTTVSADDIINYKAYSPLFSSAGQPTVEQFSTLKQDGFDKVIYVAYSDHDNSLPNADRLAKKQGLQYVHIPVEWDNPTASDFALIASVLEQDKDARTLLHCQMNFRASAFAMLYRVLYLDVDLAAAKKDMNTVWQPNQVWTDFMRETLRDGGVNPDCESCDWTVPER